MKVLAKCGTIIKVPDFHPALSTGIFAILDMQANTEMDLDFLHFVFYGKTDDPIFHAKMALEYNLRDLAKDTFLTLLDKLNDGSHPSHEIEALVGEIANLFSWNELPDSLAAQIIEYPTFEDITEIIRLGYSLCYKKFRDHLCYANYKYLAHSFLDTVIEIEGVDSSFVLCCYNGHLELAKKLVQNGANISAGHDTALVWAVKNGHLEVVQYLVSLGADVRSNDPFDILKSLGGIYRRPLRFGVLNGDFGLVENRDWAIVIAVGMGHLAMVKYLVSLGADPRDSDDLPIRNAIIRGDVEIVEYLASLGANARACDDKAVKRALYARDLPMINCLRSLGVPIVEGIDGGYSIGD